MSFLPEEESYELVKHAELLANEMLKEMPGEECVDMVRQFCGVMAEWQPNIKENINDPVLLGLHCLAAADLFKKAFVKAYAQTDKLIKAQEAIKKAFGEEL